MTSEKKLNYALRYFDEVFRIGVDYGRSASEKVTFWRPID